jgi:hypothetical protein
MGATVVNTSDLSERDLAQLGRAFLEYLTTPCECGRQVGMERLLELVKQATAAYVAVQ